MWSRAEVIAASAFLVAISVALLRLRRSATPLVGWLWFMGTLVPVLGLVTVGRQSIGDRYTYIPLLGIALLSVWLFESIRRGRGGNRVGIAIAVLTLVPLSIRTTQQLPTWKDSGTLFRHALSVTKDNDAIHNNLGTWLMTTGRATAAVDNYRRALAISSDSFLPRKNLITVFEALQEFELAAEHLEFQIARWPEDLDRRFRAGSAHRISGNPQAALDHYEFIVRQDSGNAPAWNHRGGVLMDLLRFDAAIESFEKAIALDAKYDLAHRNLVDGLVQAKRKDEAITHLENALTADPENSELRRLAARLSDPFN
jgi:tetratricopeptide (TPR) repeat protein